ncbi:MAG: hypothetical protein E7137_02770 [Rikenellaceae bacterium]|nr:hypothetical protein [Rikenellaceae bacterium]
MKNLRFLLLLLLLAACALPSRAQSLAACKEQLARPITDSVSLRTATVTATESPAAREALAQLKGMGSRTRFQGWRVCIFSDNTAEARSKAYQAMESFKEHFAGIPLYNEYASPYFRVSVGNCTNPEEAIILLNRVNKLFPKAFIKQEQLTLSDLLK